MREHLGELDTASVSQRHWPGRQCSVDRPIAQAGAAELPRDCRAGVAPMANHSGSNKERQRFQGGQFEIWHVLYMAALAASSHNPVIKPFCGRLITVATLPNPPTQAADHA